MRADRDAARLGDAERARHDLRIARMEAAGDVRRGDDRQHGVVVAAPVRAEALGEIGIKIDGRHGRASPSIPPLKGEGGERSEPGGVLSANSEYAARTPPRRFAPSLPLQGRD